MTERTGRIESALARYREEVLRWNASFNLVSRIDAESRLESLIAECVAAFRTWTEDVRPAVRDMLPACPSDLHFVDLGSGAGLPGLVWHLLAEDAGFGFGDAGSLLVEPREKRAWFLEQTAARMELKSLRVGMDQWGLRSGLKGEDLPEAVTGLITLKALRLTDAEIIAGWKRYRGDACADNLVICRFYGPDGNLDGALCERLGLPLGRTQLFPIASLPAPKHLLVSCYPSL